MRNNMSLTFMCSEVDMKRKGLMVGILLALAVTGCAANNSTVAPEYQIVHQGGRGQGFRTHRHYYVPYSCSREGTGLCQPGVVTGVIRQMRLEKNKFEAYPGLTAEIETPDKVLVHVHIAPEWFLEKYNINLKVNESVSLNGVFHELEGQDGLVASELTWNDRTISLRDDRGRPIWEAKYFKAIPPPNR
jgi:hypothetical protein